MNQIFKKLAEELKAVENTITSIIPEAVIISQHANYWGCAGINREYLIKRVRALHEIVSEIEIEVEDGSVESKDLDYFLPAFAFIRSNTIPNIPSSNGQAAIPALTITLDALAFALTPYQDFDEKKAVENTKALRKSTNQIRGLETRLRELAPKTATLEEMISRIEQAYDAADQLPSDLETLKESRQKIYELSQEAEADRIKVLSSKEDSSNILGELSKIKKEADDIIKKCQSVFSSATSVGLATAFTERSKSLDLSMWFWLAGLIAALGVGGYVGTGQLQVLTQLLTRPDGASGTLVVLNITIAILSVGAPVWFAWLATKQVGQRFRLSEDYAFKASISRAYDGYSKEAGRVDPKLEAKLLESALSRLDEQPLRLVESASYGSPWHELLSSDAFKDAMKSVPNFASQITNFAKESLTKGKSRPDNLAANSAQAVVPPGESKV
ncbi:hypothetical protein [Pseudomonas sp. LF-5]|uniref:hypothetical protein n=1 Tax=Pseudomonas TaxID=286 RepID=UPI0030A1DB5C